MLQIEPLNNKSLAQADTLQSRKTELEKKLSNAHEEHLDISALNAELSEVSELLSLYRTLLRKLNLYKQNQELIQLAEDKDLIEIAQSELPQLTQDIESVLTEIDEKEIKQKLSDPDDSKSVVLEIRAGAGGDEAALFAADLFRMYKAFATKKGWQVDVIDTSVSESGGFKQLVAQIKGHNGYKYLKHESGVHRVQRIPTTESSGRIHTSTASVAILPEAKEIEVEIKSEDLRIDTMRSSGPGGQSVNTTTSAVRITHLPSGIVVSCQDTKVQQQNKDKAMEILRARLYEKNRQEEARKRSDLRSSQIGTAMRAEKIRTYNFPQSRITDHRIKKSWHNLESIMDGEIEDMLVEVDSELLKLLLEKVKAKENAS